MEEPGVTHPVFLDQSKFLPQLLFRSLDVMMNKDNSFLTKKTTYRTGSLAGGFRGFVRSMSKKDQEKDLQRAILNDFPSAKIVSWEYLNVEGPDSSIMTNDSFTVPSLITRAGSLSIIKSLWSDKLETNNALSYEKEYTVLFFPGYRTARESMTITLQPGYEPIDLKPDVTYTSPFGDYRITYSYANGIILSTRQMIYKKDIIMPEEYAAFKTFYEKVMNEDDSGIVLKK